MYRDRKTAGKGKKGCGRFMVGLLVILLISVTLFVLHKYLVILPRETHSDSSQDQAGHGIIGAQPVQLSAPSPTPTPMATPAATVDLADLESRMQDWPEQVTLVTPATFPGDLVAPAGTDVKLISAGAEVEVEYRDEQAKLAADATDLVQRVLSHRAQIAREMEIERGIAGKGAARAKSLADGQAKELEHIYGKEPSHEEAYFGVKTYLKQVQKDPESLEIIGLSRVYTAEFGGRKCWAAKVQFRARDEMGFYKQESGVAYLDGDKSIGYEQVP